MRVISGIARGLKLNTPTDNEIRPTTDRVKESMFNIINSQVYDSVVLDLFSGSGALGIECISRGAREAYFCDKSNNSIKVLKSNLDKAKFNEKSHIITGDFNVAIKKLASQGKKFDLIFVDPPYYEGLFNDVLKAINDYGILDEEGTIIVEHDAGIELEDLGDLYIYKEKKYGITKLTFYGLEEDDE